VASADSEDDVASADSYHSFEHDMNDFGGRARLWRHEPGAAWQDLGLGQFGLPYLSTTGKQFYEQYRRHFVFRQESGIILERHCMETASGLVGAKDRAGMSESQIQESVRTETYWCWTAIGEWGKPIAFELHFENQADAHEFWAQVGEIQVSAGSTTRKGCTVLSQHAVQNLFEARDGTWARLGKGCFYFVENQLPHIARFKITRRGDESSAADNDGVRIERARCETCNYLVKDAWVIASPPTCDCTLRLAASCDIDGDLVAHMFQLHFDSKAHRVCFEIALDMTKARNGIASRSRNRATSLTNLMSTPESLRAFREALNRRFHDAGIDEIVDEDRTWPHKRKPELTTEELARLKEPE